MGASLLNVTVDIPTRPTELKQVRVHNKIVKDAMRQALENHWQRTVRGRFEPGARSKYEHFERSRKYQARKKRERGVNIDDVYSGATRKAAKNEYKVRVGGTAEEKTISASLSFKFPFAQAIRAARKAVAAAGVKVRSWTNPRTADMAAELARWTEAEAKAAVAEFLSLYMAALDKFKSGRKRKHFKG